MFVLPKLASNSCRVMSKYNWLISLNAWGSSRNSADPWTRMVHVLCSFSASMGFARAGQAKSRCPGEKSTGLTTRPARIFSLISSPNNATVHYAGRMRGRAACLCGSPIGMPWYVSPVCTAKKCISVNNKRSLRNSKSLHVTNTPRAR